MIPHKHACGPRLIVLLLGLAFLNAVFVRTPAQAAENQQVYRIAYVEASPYWNYPQYLKRLRAALNDEGWGARVSFPDDLHFSFGKGDEARKTYREQARAILARNDYDLLLSFGTEATMALLAENIWGRPIIGCSINNPIAADIVKSRYDSGSPYFTTAFNSEASKYMFLIFHELVQFKRLGIMYNNSEASRIYSYVAEAHEVARDRGFTVVEYDRLRADESLEDCMAGVRSLHEQGMDALFVSSLTCVDLEQNDPSPMYDFLYAKKIPTFAVEDKEQVKRFALMGHSLYDEKALALFQARQAKAILSGKKPGELPMTVPFNYKLLINLTAASKLGITFSLDVLRTADEIYLEQDGAKKD